MPQFDEARRIMVDNQIRTFDVTDRDVLSAFDHVPRHRFVEAKDEPLAYSDARLSVEGSNLARPLLQPLVLARLIQALAPQAGEHALDCFGGFGYSAALLKHMGLDVVAFESDSALAGSSTARLTALAPGVSVLPVGNIGPHFGLFDVILVNGAVEVEPTLLLDLLKDGGRLGVIVRQGKAAQARVFLRSGRAVSSRFAFDAQAPVLPGFAPAPSFVF
jgi:protein-L-isoaspartate(D-aspartate) O-methyltransferase